VFVAVVEEETCNGLEGAVVPMPTRLALTSTNRVSVSNATSPLNDAAPNVVGVIFSLPLKETPPMVLAVVSVAAEPAEPAEVAYPAEVAEPLKVVVKCIGRGVIRYTHIRLQNLISRHPRINEC